MNRIWFALKESYSNREEIKKALCNENNVLKNTLSLTIDKIKRDGVKVLVLDFDGVLSAHGENKPLPDIMTWLSVIYKEFSGEIAILSNKPNIQRAIFFNKNFPDIKFISDVAKKPYPEGLVKICSIFNVQPEEVALVDDRILTGVLACILAGCKVYYVSQAYKSYSKRPITEYYFSILRWFEKKIFINKGR